MTNRNISELTGVSNPNDLLTKAGGDSLYVAKGFIASDLQAGSVALTALTQLNAGTILGNNGLYAGAPSALSAASVAAMLPAFTSDTKGVVPASGGSTNLFLCADGTWKLPDGTGGGAGVWGSIGGTIALQSDLIALLNAKQAAGSYATLAQVNAKEDTITGGQVGDYWRGDKTWHPLDRTALGLGNIDNTADSAKPVSTTQQAALDLKADRASPTFTGAVAVTGTIAATGTITAFNLSGTNTGDQSKASLGLGNVDNTSDANKPISSATQSALDGKAALAGATFTGAIAATNLSGTNTGNETYSTITTKLAGGSGGGTTNFLRADGTFAAPPGGGGGTWGSITGTLASQSDLSTALGLKAPLASPTFTGTLSAASIAASGTVTGSNLSGTNTGDQTKASLGLGNVDNTSDANKPISTATQTALNGKVNSNNGVMNLLTVSQATQPEIDFQIGSGTIDNLIFADNAGLTLSSINKVTLQGSSFNFLYGKATFNSSSAGTASIKLPTTGTAPTTPGEGDIWATTSGLFARINGATASLVGTNSGDETYSTLTTKLAAGSGGGTTNFLRADGTFAAPPGGSGGSGTVTGVTGTAPIASSGGTAPVISITAATTGSAGSMSAADKTKLDGIASGATANTGTLTAVSVTTANGISGTSSGGATPALTLSLGAITPTSVAATGTVTGSNLSGTNTGDQDLSSYATTSALTTGLAGKQASNSTLSAIGALSYAGNANKVLAVNSSATGVVWATAASGATWGGITGLIGSQSDLYTELMARAPTSNPSFTGNVSATGTITGSNLSGTNTGDDTYSTLTSKLAGGSGGDTAKYLRADGTWQVPAGAGSATWGAISGTLSSQTDLQTALNNKLDDSQATVFGLSLLDDANAAAGRTTLGLGTAATNNTGDFQAASGRLTALASLDGTAGIVEQGDTGGFSKRAIGTTGTNLLTRTGADSIYQPLATVLTNTTASFTTAQETKLTGIATAATANATDANLRDRTTHTGAQAISTVTGLQTALDGKQASGTYATGTGSATGTNTGDQYGFGGFMGAAGVNAEIIGGYIAPAAFTITQAKTSAIATVAATASTVYTIKNKTTTTTIGTLTFAAAGTSATVSITSGSVAAGDFLVVEGPATADTTLANLAFRVA